MLYYYSFLLLFCPYPGFPFRILSRSFGEKLRDKMRNGKPGFEASIYLLSLLNSQNREAGPFVVTQTGPGDTFGCQKWSPGPILVLLGQVWQDGTIFGNQKWSGGDHFWQPKTVRGTSLIPRPLPDFISQPCRGGIHFVHRF